MNEKLCNHRNKIFDNYGESCYDCGKQISGYGYGGWFGRNITTQTCIHAWSTMGEGSAKVCIYCETIQNEKRPTASDRETLSQEKVYHE